MTLEIILLFHQMSDNCAVIICTFTYYVELMENHVGLIRVGMSFMCL